MTGFGYGNGRGFVMRGVRPRKHSSRGLFLPPPNLRLSRKPSNFKMSVVPSPYLSVATIHRSILTGLGLLRNLGSAGTAKVFH